jgi:hypothetical protein
VSRSWFDRGGIAFIRVAGWCDPGRVVHGLATTAGKRYYYRARRVNGRPVQVYVGTGLVGEEAATADARRRVEQEAQGRAWRQAQARCTAALTPLVELSDLINVLAHATLLAEGFHRHYRTWRRNHARTC